MIKGFRHFLIPLIFASIPIAGWFAFVADRMPILQAFYLIPGSILSLGLNILGIKKDILNDALTLVLLVLMSFMVGVFVENIIFKKGEA